VKSFPLLTIALVAAAATAPACRPHGGGSAAYGTAALTRGDLAQAVTASGTLDAVVSVDVGSQVSGKISVLKADFNSTVKKGQLIAEIDPSLYAADLRQAAGELASARATVLLKRQNLERKRALVPVRAASQSDLDQAEAELAQAEAAVMVKEAAVDKARANLGYCKITSPVDGIVISRKVDAGQTLAASLSTPVLFRIAQDITKMHISAAVSEADIGRVRVGQGVSFTVDAYPDEVFHGIVAQVRKAATTTSNVVTYETMIDVENPDQKLFPGMTADVSILVARRTDVLEAPNAALRFAPPAGARFEKDPPRRLNAGERLAYAPGADGSTLRALVLRVGITDGVNTEVIQGASAGQQVVTSTLSGGARSGSFGPGGNAPPPNP
jgi:HlyD family secretion protein